LLPLLEHERRWEELERVLEAEAPLATGHERAAVLARLGAIRLARLDDPTGAIAAYRDALAIDPADRTSRPALEKMLAAGGETSPRQGSSHMILSNDQR